MDRVILTVLIAIGSTLALPPSSSKQYRDYVYNRRTDAFYKLHPEGRYKVMAEHICAIEGAKLMVPSSPEDIAQVHGLLKAYPDIGDFVFVGDDGANHEDAGEVPIIDLSNMDDESPSSPSQCDVVTRKGEVDSTPCHFWHPFICKVTATDAPYNEQCDVYATGYKYYNDVKSCYKVPEVALAWEEALYACKQENAHLVVINSDAESDRLKEFLRTAPRLAGAVQTYFFHAGIRANMPTDGSQRVFRTVLNQTLEEAGFARWSTGEPNNYNNMEYCGTIFSNNGLYNDVNCDDLFGFICEKEVASA